MEPTDIKFTSSFAVSVADKSAVIMKRFSLVGLDWRLAIHLAGATPKNNESISIYLYLESAKNKPHGWSQRAAFKMEIVNKLLPSKSIVNESQETIFSRDNSSWGWLSFARRSEVFHSQSYFKDDAFELRVTLTIPSASMLQSATAPLSSLMFTERKHTDVTFVIKSHDGSTSGNKEEVKAHRAVLATRSPFCESLLYNGMAESQKSRIEISDIGCDAFSRVIEYLYNGCWDETSKVSLAVLMEVISFAAKHCITDLLSDALGSAKQRVITETAVEAVKAVSASTEVPEEYREWLLQWVRDHLEAVKKTANFRTIEQPDIMDIIMCDPSAPKT